MCTTVHAGDVESRLQFCEWAPHRVRQDPILVDKSTFTDKFTFVRNEQTSRHAGLVAGLTKTIKSDKSIEYCLCSVRPNSILALTLVLDPPAQTRTHSIIII